MAALLLLPACAHKAPLKTPTEMKRDAEKAQQKEIKDAQRAKKLQEKDERRAREEEERARKTAVPGEMR